MKQVKVSHYSDILCIWAYVCQIRMEELMANFGQQLELSFHLFPVFAATEKKFRLQWQDRGGINAYNQHVCEIAEGFPHIQVNPEVWIKARPTSSLPAHLYLLAVRLLEQRQEVAAGSFTHLASEIRKAFFIELSDVSHAAVLDKIAAAHSLPVDRIKSLIDDGQAYAEVAEDIQQAQQLFIRSSPTILFNEDRQRLAGNVGYRIIEANIRELIDHPGDQQSWC